MWAFIFPLSCLPLVACMLHMRWRARKTEEWKELSTQKSFTQTHGFVQTIVQLFWKLDVIGVLLMAVVLGCILVPLTLAGGTSSKWNNPHIIAPFVLGFVLIPFFIYWESKWAHEPIAPFKLAFKRSWYLVRCLYLFLDQLYLHNGGRLFVYHFDCCC